MKLNIVIEGMDSGNWKGSLDYPGFMPSRISFKGGGLIHRWEFEIVSSSCDFQDGQLKVVSAWVKPVVNEISNPAERAGREGVLRINGFKPVDES